MQQNLIKKHIHQVEAYSITLGQDKSQLVAKITSLETERASLSTERAELRSDVERLKDDLEALSEERASHEASITAFNEKIVLLTVDKEKVCIIPLFFSLSLSLSLFFKHQRE